MFQNELQAVGILVFSGYFILHGFLYFCFQVWLCQQQFKALEAVLRIVNSDN